MPNETPLNLKPAYRIKNRACNVDHSKLHNTDALKQQLMGEMLELDKQKQQLSLSQTEVNFSMLQTYREMIQSRRMLLDRLNR